MINVLEDLIIEFDEMGYEPTILCDTQKEVDSFRNRLKQVLDYLKAIDNSKPSKALEELDSGFEVKTKEYGNMIAYGDEQIDTIEQALIKAQENEDKTKAFDLINEKDVDVKLLKWAYPSVEAYNVKVRTEKDYWWRKELTQEEFEFIGRIVGAK